MKGEREEESISGRGLTRVKTQRREGRRDTVALQKLKHGVGENPEVPKVSWLCQRASVSKSEIRKGKSQRKHFSSPRKQDLGTRVTPCHSDLQEWWHQPRATHNSLDTSEAPACACHSTCSRSAPALAHLPDL